MFKKSIDHEPNVNALSMFSSFLIYSGSKKSNYLFLIKFFNLSATICGFSSHRFAAPFIIEKLPIRNNPIPNKNIMVSLFSVDPLIGKFEGIIFYTHSS